MLTRDARITKSISELASNEIDDNLSDIYVLVPYDLPFSEIPSTAGLRVEPFVVTDMWIEKCLHNNKVISPVAHITSTPFPRFPIPGGFRL